MTAGAVTLVSADGNGQLGNGSNSFPAFSPDGTEVAFVSTSIKKRLVRVKRGRLALAKFARPGPTRLTNGSALVILDLQTYAFLRNHSFPSPFPAA
ncbi:MAG: hypothetical protein DMG39_14495 [Acidobacteria bacterium]|nr:MAG: hypothetical protein DMG39_14495 [Acidobacteriota bacterium]